VYTLHDLTWWFYPETASRLGRIYYSRVALMALLKSFIVVPSDSVKHDLKSQFPVNEDRIFTIHNGLTEFAINQEEVKIIIPKNFILIVGTLEPRKNLQNFLKAYEASSANDQYELVIVGRKGWGALPENVHLYTACSDSELAYIYSRADAFFLPSIYEGFGLPLIEALFFQIPIFCSDISVFREVGGQACNYFNPRNILAIITALNLFVDNKYFFDKNLSRQVAQKFDWHQTGKATLRCYREVALTLNLGTSFEPL